MLLREWGESQQVTVKKNSADFISLLSLRSLLSDQEEGQVFVHLAVDWGEKAVRNTRSDGRDRINQTLKELQAEWEKLLRKMSAAKVSVETDLLQWSDAQQSVSRLQGHNSIGFITTHT